jgi:hypothetical protein
MWSMMGLSPDWMSQTTAEGEEVAWDSDDNVHVGDIVVIATRALKPIFKTSENVEDQAELRVLGEAQGDSKMYICLVTAGDAEHVRPTIVVGKNQAFNYGVESRFYGCDGIIVTENHIRRIAKKQRGRHCEKCTDYNEDIRMAADEAYLCLTCRQNPYR